MSKDTEPCFFCKEVYFNTDLKWFDDYPICNKCIKKHILHKVSFEYNYAISDLFPTKKSNLILFNSMYQLGFKLIGLTSLSCVFIKMEMDKVILI